MSTATSETVRLTVPSDILAIYEQQAKARGGHPVEWIMNERLRNFAHTNSEKPIVLDDESRRMLERLLAKNFSNADAIVSAVTHALSVRVDSIEIPLSPQLLAKLQSRCLGMDWKAFVTQTITRSLEEFTGLR